MAAFMARTYRQVTGSPAEIAETPFTDTPEDSFAFNDIGRIYGLDITKGTNSSTYSPRSPVLRSHMALFLARLYRLVTGVDAPVVNTDFTDIGRRSPDQQDAIAQIYGLGITTGTTPTTFSPRAGVTREQMASFIARLYRTLTNTTAEAPSGLTTEPSGLTTEPSGDDGTELTVTWEGPSFTGGNTVTGYFVQWKSGDEDYATTRQQSSRVTTTTIPGLTKGTEYTLRVAAVNANGPWSVETTGTPAVAPGLVSNFNVESGNMELTLTWEPPTDDGGSDITGYLVEWTANRRVDPLDFEVEDPTLRTHTITGLQNTTAANPSEYYVWITAVNAAGRGPRTPAPNGEPVSPSTVAAGLPTNLAVTPSATSGTELIVNWQAPLDDGGEPVESYRVERNCATSTGTTGWETTGIPGNPAGRVDVPNVPTETYSITITGLGNGQPCEVRARAVNIKTSPSGPWRWASATATPVQVPGPPRLDASGVLSAHEALQVTWTPPTDTGGGLITGYEITYSSGGTPLQISVTGSVTSTTITGLSNGFGYTVSVKAISGSGKSQPSSEVTAIPKAVPAAPRNVNAGPPPAVDTSGNAVVVDPESLLVTWDPPADNGTNPVLGYVVEYRESYVPRSSPNANDQQNAGNWRPATLTAADINSRTVTISGLKDIRSGQVSGRGVSFDVRVRATNDHDGDGTTTNPTPTEGGPWATASGIPATAPAAVTPTLEPGHTSIIVSWDPPTDNGSDITHYLIRYAENFTGNEPYSADIRVNAPVSRARITGLQVGVPYVVQVQAVNAIGTGPNLAGEIQATTGLFPDAPTSVRVVPTPNGNGSTLTVTWNRVTRTNGAGPVSSYIVETLDVTNPGSTWFATTGIDGNTTTAVVNVIIGRTYLVRVKAVALNTGSSGYIDAPVTAAGSPATPALLAATIATDGVTVNVVWTAVSQGTPSDITSYTVSWFSTTDPVGGARGTVLITSNTTGTYAIRGLSPGSYTVQVSSTNHVGNSARRTANVTVPARS